MQVTNIFKKGLMGENYIENLLLSKGIKYVRDLYLKSDNSFAQLDFVVVTAHGLVCIEVKNYADCIIKGSFDGDVWTNIYWSGTNCEYNPVRQNRKHCETLKRYFNNDLIDKEIEIKNLVLISDKCKLDLEYDVINNKEGVVVTHFSDLYLYLTRLKHESSEFYNKKEVNEIYKYVRRLEIRNKKLAMEHSVQFG